MNVESTMVEKDFWVCWTLKSIFSLPVDHPAMTFKGGTSLSKAYGLINRFSEDIDIVTDPHFFIEHEDADPEEAGISRSSRSKRILRLDEAATAYIAERLLLVLRDQFASRLKSMNGWSIDRDANDPFSLLFMYPKSDPSRAHSYVRDVVKIELGWRAKAAPSELRSVRPYVAEIPMLLDSPEIECSVLVPDRTFWEKVTALHAESHRETTSRFFSRHYSDVAAILGTEIGQRACADFNMLEDVRAFKNAYYHAAWARYDLAVPGSLAIVPGAKKLRDLAADYRSMEQMFLTEPPLFEEVIKTLRKFEDSVNAKASAGHAL